MRSAALTTHRYDEVPVTTIVERVEKQFAELRADLKATNQRIDVTNQRIDVTNEKLSNIDRKVTEIGMKLTVLLWVMGGLGTSITILVAVGKALHWF
jgi:septal ring factor EnvC (AmiA/AmiB activator)